MVSLSSSAGPGSGYSFSIKPRVKKRTVSCCAIYKFVSHVIEEYLNSGRDPALIAGNLREYSCGKVPGCLDQVADCIEAFFVPRERRKRQEREMK